MIEYIRNDSKGAILYQNDGAYTIHSTAFSWVKQMCLAHFFSHEGYTKAVEKKFSRSKKIPIVLSSHLILIPSRRIRDYENIWFNSCQIERVTPREDGIEIRFISQNILRINLSYRSYLKQTKLANRILLEKVKHFHI